MDDLNESINSPAVLPAKKRKSKEKSSTTKPVRSSSRIQVVVKMATPVSHEPDEIEEDLPYELCEVLRVDAEKFDTNYKLAPARVTIEQIISQVRVFISCLFTHSHVYVFSTRNQLTVLTTWTARSFLLGSFLAVFKRNSCI